MCMANVQWGYDEKLETLAYDGMELARYIEDGGKLDTYGVDRFTDAIVQCCKKGEQAEELEFELLDAKSEIKELEQALDNLTKAYEKHTETIKAQQETIEDLTKALEKMHAEDDDNEALPF